MKRESGKGKIVISFFSLFDAADDKGEKGPKKKEKKNKRERERRRERERGRERERNNIAC